MSSPSLQIADTLLPASSGTLRRAVEYLLSRRAGEGYWCGELEADSMLEADYIFLHTLLESGDPERLKRAFTEMMRYQKDDGRIERDSAHFASAVTSGLPSA